MRAPGLLGQLVIAGVLSTAAVLTFVSCQPEHVPAHIQRQLPLLPGGFGELCPKLSATPAERRRTIREADVLLRELKRRPDEVVTIEDSSFDEGHEPYDITVRELAERRLEGLRLNSEWLGDCAPRLRQRLTAALK